VKCEFCGNQRSRWGGSAGTHAHGFSGD
jgi:hypothetical protein